RRSRLRLDNDDLRAAVGLAALGGIVGFGWFGLSAAFRADHFGRNMPSEHARDLTGTFLRQLPVRAKREGVDRHVVGVTHDDNARSFLADFSTDLVQQSDKLVLNHGASRCEQAAVANAYQRALTDRRHHYQALANFLLKKRLQLRRCFWWCF